MNRLRRYMPVAWDALRGASYSPDSIRFISAVDLFHDFDGLFARYIKECRFREISDGARLEIKNKNTAVKPWPMRLGKDATQEEFDLLFASDNTGCERYVE